MSLQLNIKIGLYTVALWSGIFVKVTLYSIDQGLPWQNIESKHIFNVDFEYL